MAEKKTAAVVESPTEARIINYIKAAYPILWLQTAEESRAERELLNIAKKMQRRISVWSFTEGFLNLQEDGKESRASGDASSEDPIEALKKIKDEAANVGQIYIFRDLHAFFNNPKVVRLLRDIAREFKQGKKVLVVLSPLNKLPPEAERDITLVDYGLPNRPVITKIWDNMYAKNKTGIVKTNGDKEFSADEHEKISQAALGLTTVEAENAFGKAVIEWAALPIEDRPTISSLVMKEKAAAVKKSGILEYFERRESIKDIGGLEALKSWLDVRKRALSLSAREFGLPMPRGILLVGLPGCGKSLVAKATAGILGVPLIRFDIGRVFAGLVGQSEMNMRSALQTIDAIGNCLTGDTQVTMKDGSLLQIDQIKVGDEVACVDEKTGKITTTKVIHVQSRRKDTIRLSNKSGDSVTATLDHRFLVLTDGEMVWKQASELKIGDLVGVPVKLPFNKDVSVLDLLPKEARIYGVDRSDKRVPAYVRCDSEKYPDPFMNKCLMTKDEWLSKDKHRVSTGAGLYLSEVTVPSRISEEMCYVAGLVASDGHIGGRHVGFTNSQKLLHEPVRNFMKSLLLNPVTRESLADSKYESYKQLSGISENPSLAVIEETKTCGKLFSQIFRALQEKLLTLDPDLLRWWLAGYVDGDGSTSLPQHPEKIVICSKKSKNAQLVREVIRRLGIIPPKWDGKAIEVSGQRARDLAIMLTNKVKTPWKSDNIKSIIRSEKVASSRDSGFKVGKKLKALRKNAGIKSTAMSVGSGSISRAESDVSICEQTLSRINDDLKGSFDYLLNSDVRWVPITKLEEIGEETVYDISCEGDNTHSFIANGIVAHNCVVWIDEMEKAFAGMGSSSTTDSGVSQRVFGSLITWMQEKSSPSFMVATVNRIEGLPPELLRKGRFDEIFFVDLPTAKERQEILKIHLEKDRRTEEFQDGAWRYKFDEVFKNKSELENCISASENFSGAELEEAIVTALYTAYYRDDKAADKFGLYIYGAIQNTRALAKTNEGQLKAMKTWAENNAVHASIKAGTKKADARTLDIG
jgi:SpoVK/Ycf46/Vps4 family AAA+-type ATPase